MKFKLALGALAAVSGMVAIASPTYATTINFDDISVSPGNYVAIASPYQGLNWSDVYVENNIAGNGYDTGIVSQSNAALNGFGTQASFSAASGTFAFISGYFTGAFGTENIVVSDNLGDSKIFQVNASTPTLETFNWNGVSTVSVDAVSDGSGTQIVFDNLTVNTSAVPEPATWAMMLVGFGGLGAVMRTRRKMSAAVAA